MTPPAEETAPQLPDTKIWRSPLKPQIDQMLLQNKRLGKPLYQEIIDWAAEQDPPLKLNATDLSRHYKKYLEKSYTLALLDQARQFSQEILAANATQEVLLQGVLYKGILEGFRQLKKGKMKIGGRELAALIGRAIDLLKLEVTFYRDNPDEYVARVMVELLDDEPDVLRKVLERLKVRAEKQVDDRKKTMRELWEEAGRSDEGDA